MFDRGTAEEDGPVTWETPARPRGRGQAETWAMGAGLRPVGKPSERPPDPTAARAVMGAGGERATGVGLRPERETAGRATEPYGRCRLSLGPER